MSVYLNDEEYKVSDGELLYDFLLEHFPPPETTYVWLNGAFVSRFTYGQRPLRDGDRLVAYRVPSGG